MNAPSIDTSSSQKRKHAPSSTSVSDHDGLTKNMEQIADSINGLVGVTKQSHQTQQMNILHRRCKELEDTVQALDNLCMELELKTLEESCPRKKKVYRKTLEKRRSTAKQEGIGRDNTINSQSSRKYCYCNCWNCHSHCHARSHAMLCQCGWN